MPRQDRQTLITGPLKLAIELDPAGRLISVRLPKQIPADLDAATLSQALAKLEKYVLAPDGPDFMQKVWARMEAIPWGHALTYGELAAAAGRPKASRAIGQACAKNRLPLIIPCHRVLASEGPGGFAGGLAWKAKLLEIESEPRP